MTAIDHAPLAPTPLDEQRLDAHLGDNFTAEWVGDGFLIDCSGCDLLHADDIDDAIALIETHRDRHDRENREVWV